MEIRNRKTQALALEAPFATTLTLAALLSMALATIASAVPAPVIHNYFPLREGNRWTFVLDEQRIINPPQDPYPMEVVEVTGSRNQGGHELFEVSNYLFRLGEGATSFASPMDAQSTVMEIRGSEAGIWYRFVPGASIELPRFANDCVHGSKGSVIGRTNLLTPAGYFQECLEIRYDSVPCGKIGLVSEIFAPGIGLVQRQLTNEDNVLETWVLQIAVVNGVTIGGSQSNPSARGMAASPTARSTSWGGIKAAFGN